MVILGIVLLIIGIVLLLAPIPFANADAAGWLLALLGVVLILVGLLVGSDIDLDHASASPLRSSWSSLLPAPLLARLMAWRHRRRVLRASSPYGGLQDELRAAREQRRRRRELAKAVVERGYNFDGR